MRRVTMAALLAAASLSLSLATAPAGHASQCGPQFMTDQPELDCCGERVNALWHRLTGGDLLACLH